MSSSPSDSNALPAAVGAPTPAPAVGAVKPRVPLFTAEAWAPLKSELFRSLWIATSIAQIGTWVREAAGPTLMEHLAHSLPNTPEMVARVGVFSNLPICLFSVFAGALADVLDRRRLLIVTQLWMVVVSAVLGILAFTGHITPVGLLFFTFLLGAGTAAFGPALQGLLPELVPKQHFALAINMNSIALNVARAVGPALFIVVVTIIPGDRGAGVSFILTALSFVAAVWVMYRWKRPPQRAAVHGEEMWSAIRSGFWYTVHSRANRAILLRVLTFIVPAVVIWMQMPIIATKQLHMINSNDPNYAQEMQRISALLYAFVGTGAIFGVFLMPGLHGRYKIDPVVNACTALFALGLILLSFVHTLWLAAIILVFLGINWVIIPTNFNTATQKSVPAWVKGRAISFYLTVLFGSFAVGGAIWGRVATHWNIETALFIGGLSMGVMLLLAYWFPLTLNEGLDLGPAYQPGEEPAAGGSLVLPSVIRSTPSGGGHGGSRVLDYAGPGPAGPVQVTVEYQVDRDRREEFLTLMRQMAEQRRRNGASRWELSEAGLVNDAGDERYVERFCFGSAAECTRQTGRMTQADLALHERARSFHTGAGAPTVTHAPADFPTRTQAASDWLQEQLSHGFERSFEELGVALDRLRALREREGEPEMQLQVTFRTREALRESDDAS
jgi:MFS family permease